MRLTNTSRIAAALVAVVTVGAAGTALADEAETGSGFQVRSHVRAGGKASDPRALPGAVDLLQQAACREGADLLQDGDPGRVKVELAVYRQQGPTDATKANVPNVDCTEKMERQSAFRTIARVVYPKPGGGTSKSGRLSMDAAVELAAKSANLIAPRVLETGNRASITVVAAQDPKSVRQMIQSLATRYRLDVTQAISVAECESGLNPKSYSPPYAGVYQHDENRWPKRAATYGHEGASVFDPYANIDVALQMARASGWGAWANCA
jgi:hypothetical protein